MSPWTPRSGMPSAPRPSYGRRTFLAAGLAGVLVFAMVVSIGFLASGGQRYDNESNENLAAYTMPSGSWAGGAQQTWSTTIDTDSSVFSVAGQMFTVSPSTDTSATLTAYTLADGGPNQAWTTTVDTSNDGDRKPSFLPWGTSTLIHGTTLYDVSTGATSQAPWTDQHAVFVAEDMAIACDTSDTCSGYKEGSTTAVWSAAIPETSEGVTNPSVFEIFDLNVFVRPEGRFAIMHHYAVNIDTGEVVTINIPMKDIYVYAIASASDGWAVRAISSSGETRMFSYTMAGGDPIDSYGDTSGLAEDVRPIYPSRPRSLEDFKSLWTEKDLSNVLATTVQDDSQCSSTVEMVGGQTITLPAYEGQNQRCYKTIRITNDSKVLIAGDLQTVSLSSFHVMFNATTGEQISFPGLDPATGAVFEAVSADLVVGYDPATGTLAGYRPA